MNRYKVIFNGSGIATDCKEDFLSMLDFWSNYKKYKCTLKLTKNIYTLEIFPREAR